MARLHSSRRVWLALLLLGVAVAILASLGCWQLRRAEQREALRAAIDAGRAGHPVTLATNTPAADLMPWRPARATGSWLPQADVLLENRNQNGRPGYWLATPLMLDAASRTAVLVLRGWLPRRLDGQLPALPQAPVGPQAIQGELAARVPRLFELWSAAGASRLPAQWKPGEPTPVVQNLALDEYARAAGLNLLPVVLMQTQGDDALVRDWPQPSVNADQNRGYALQWFLFTAIAAGAWIVVAVRAWRARSSRD